VETNKINYITIQQYLDGSLDEDAMHELEKQALDDPFLADAIEGYAQINKPATRQLSLLQTQLHERIAQQQETKNVLSFSWQRLSVAAAACLLFVTASLLFFIREQKREEQLALQPKRVDVQLLPRNPEEKQASPNMEQTAPVVQSEGENMASSAQKLRPKQTAAAKSGNVVAQNGAAPEAVERAAAKKDLPSSGELNEVVIIGYGTQQKRDIAGAVSSISQAQIPENLSEKSEPSVGWSSYNDYLKTAVQQSTIPFSRGRVELKFVVNRNGQLGNFEITKGLDEITNQEAIRLVKSGPAWQRGVDSTATVTIRFRK
jgi:hypothetical protein